MRAFEPFPFLKASALALLLLSVSVVEAAQISWDKSSAPITFAATELHDALAKGSHSTAARIELRAAGAGSPAKGFAIISDGTVVRITGANAIETMYGGLELAEQLRMGRDIFAPGEFHREPFIAKRGVKFNIPLDARTPSYDDTGDAAQRNIAEMWNLEFWTEFLDQMARDRYNVLSLWNPHPFPSMVRSTTFPEVALTDVCVTTLVPNGRENEWGEPQLVSENIVANLKVVKRLTIDEKITFWRAVMRYARERGIDVYFITWNIAPNAVARPVPAYYRTYANAVPNEQPGKYGVTHDVHNPATIRYLRDAVKTFILTYPDLKGIGITAGEHFPEGDDFDREAWLWATYGLGVLDAKTAQPDRRIDFIHRFWNTGFEKIMQHWGGYPDRFDFSFKYAKARLYSAPTMPFADSVIREMKPRKLQSWWNLRNDDIFVHRWGDPDYVRAFLQNFDLEATAGYYLGSDGYVWGREFVSRTPKSPRELEISKHWYAFMLWGRLGYDPTLNRDYFVARLAERFPKANSGGLYETWQTASKIIPLINCFYWRDWDHMWSIENSNSHVEGFHGVELFADNQPMEGSGIMRIRDYVRLQGEGKPTPGITPIQVAGSLDDFTTAALQGAEAMPATDDADLRATLDDIRGMAWLGRYYADKIRAAVALAAFQKSGSSTDRDAALRHIQSAYENCTHYVDHSMARYHSQMLARTGLFDWSAMLNSARKDVSIIRNLK